MEYAPSGVIRNNVSEALIPESFHRCAIVGERQSRIAQRQFAAVKRVQDFKLMCRRNLEDGPLASVPAAPATPNKFPLASCTSEMGEDPLGHGSPPHGKRWTMLKLPAGVSATRGLHR